MPITSELLSKLESNDPVVDSLNFSSLSKSDIEALTAALEGNVVVTNISGINLHLTQHNDLFRILNRNNGLPIAIARKIVEAEESFTELELEAKKIPQNCLKILGQVEHLIASAMVARVAIPVGLSWDDISSILARVPDEGEVKKRMMELVEDGDILSTARLAGDFSGVTSLVRDILEGAPSPVMESVSRKRARGEGSVAELSRIGASRD